MKASVLIFLVCITAVLSATTFQNRRRSFIEKPAFRKSRGHPKVIGGEEVKPNSIPFQVALHLDGYFCGGSLITPRHVLTAGHCGVLTDKPQAVFGAHKVTQNEPTQVIISGKPKVHEKYDEADNLRNDIAIITLDQPVELSDIIQTVELADEDIGDLVGETAQVSGWGKTHDSDTSISPVLRAVNSTLLANDDCQEQFGSGISVFDTVVCLDGSDLKSSCNGDSGGPLVIRRNGDIRQVGLTSYGIIWGCEVGYPSAFTRISSYRPWIDTNTQ